MGFLSGQRKGQIVPTRAGLPGLGAPLSAAAGRRSLRRKEPRLWLMCADFLQHCCLNERTNETVSFGKNTLLTRSYGQSARPFRGARVSTGGGAPSLGAAGSGGRPSLRSLSRRGPLHLAPPLEAKGFPSCAFAEPKPTSPKLLTSWGGWGRGAGWARRLGEVAPVTACSGRRDELLALPGGA